MNSPGRSRAWAKVRAKVGGIGVARAFACSVFSGPAFAIIEPVPEESLVHLETSLTNSQDRPTSGLILRVDAHGIEIYQVALDGVPLYRKYEGAYALPSLAAGATATVTLEGRLVEGTGEQLEVQFWVEDSNGAAVSVLGQGALTIDPLRLSTGCQTGGGSPMSFLAAGLCALVALSRRRKPL
jgi:uncharacterized protein (TIGR03382 family)